MRSELTTLLLRYRNREVSYQKVLEASILFVYWHLRPYCQIPQDEWHEFMSQTIPRIEKLIEGFDDRGKDFEAYLSSSIRFRLLSFWTSKTKSYHQSLQNFEMSSVYETYSSRTPQMSWTVEETLPASLATASRVTVYNTDLNSLTPFNRRIVIYVLKNSVWVRDRFLTILGRRINIDPNWLIEKRTEVLDLMEPMWQERMRLSELSSKFLEELHETHRVLQSWNTMPPETRILYQQREKFFRRKITRTSQRIEEQTLTPTHSDLARILGVPKGSIDSTMYYLRVYWHSVEPTIKELIAELSS